jgi:putative endonuclease
MTKTRGYTGRYGEELAARYLVRRGYRIVVQNYRVPCGEVDIIAQDGEVLVFVEVKTRTGQGFGAPAEAVTYRKRQQISKAALTYLGQQRLLDRPARFDVVSVLLGNGSEPQIEIIKNAFDLSYAG